MTEQEAMQQALEALKESIDVPCYGGHPKQEAAYHALQKALANKALDKKAENVRELGLDYKPAKYSDIVSDGGLDPRNKFDKPAQQEFVSPGGGYVPAIPAQQPAQQEPVAWRERFYYGTENLPKRFGDWKLRGYSPTPDKDNEVEPLYTSPPPQRTWVGLTDEEIEKEWVKMCGSQSWARHKVYARNIESAIRSKNENNY